MSVQPSKLPTGVPVRTCVGCRQRATKTELLRVVIEDLGDGPEVVPDPRGRAPGRGAHLHPTPDCLEQALRRRAFVRALRVASRPGGWPGGRLGSSRLAEYVEECAERSGADRSTTNRPRRRWSSSS